MKIIHLTDPHVRAHGECVRTVDTATRFAAVVDDVARRHADADLVVVTGDLVGDREPASYALFRDLIGRIRAPVRLLMGNHDRRALFRAAFPEHPVDADGFIQSCLDAPGLSGRLLFLDSLEEGSIGGRLCDKRLAWIAARLAEAGDRPVTIFLHHPPLSVGVPHFVNICLHDPEGFLALLRAHRGGVRHIFFGHIHIPVSGVYPGGLPYTAARGSAHQILLDFDTDAVAWASGKANYNVIDLGDDGLAVHSFDFLNDELIARGPPCAGP
jgi:3',5'-cyclic AMP phosphodiesterase CpdA